MLAFGYQLRLLSGAARRGSAIAVFYLGSEVSALIAMLIAIPDPNWPVFWILVLGGFACLAQESSDRDLSDDAAEIPRQGASGDVAMELDAEGVAGSVPRRGT